MKNNMHVLDHKMLYCVHVFHHMKFTIQYFFHFRGLERLKDGLFYTYNMVFDKNLWFTETAFILFSQY